MHNNKALKIDVGEGKPKKKKNKLLEKWLLSKPFALPLGEWKYWKQEAKKNFPIRYFLQESVPSFFSSIKFKADRRYWQVVHRIHPKHRYHVLKPRSIEPGYIDPSEMMLHANFELLTAFVEFESSEHGMTDWEGTSSDAAKAWETMKELNNWWTIIRPGLEDTLPEYPEVDDILSIFSMPKDSEEYKEWRRIGDIHTKFETQWALDDNNNLKRLIDVREYMWH